MDINYLTWFLPCKLKFKAWYTEPLDSGWGWYNKGQKKKFSSRGHYVKKKIDVKSRCGVQFLFSKFGDYDFFLYQ